MIKEKRYYISRLKGADYYKVGYSYDLNLSYIRFKEEFDSFAKLNIILNLKGYEVDSKIDISKYPNLIDMKEMYLLKRI